MREEVFVESLSLGREIMAHSVLAGVAEVAEGLDVALAAILGHLARVREAAWEGWEASKRAEAAKAGEERAEPVGNATFLRMVLTCLDRQIQLLDLKSRARTEPELVTRALTRLGGMGDAAAAEGAGEVTQGEEEAEAIAELGLAASTQDEAEKVPVSPGAVSPGSATSASAVPSESVDRAVRADDSGHGELAPKGEPAEGKPRSGATGLTSLPSPEPRSAPRERRLPGPAAVPRLSRAQKRRLSKARG